MAKKVKSLFKKIGKSYVEGVYMLYKPLIDHGISPLF
jgi:hypothetical protein